MPLVPMSDMMSAHVMSLMAGDTRTWPCVRRLRAVSASFCHIYDTIAPSACALISPFNRASVDLGVKWAAPWYVCLRDTIDFRGSPDIRHMHSLVLSPYCCDIDDAGLEQFIDRLEAQGKMPYAVSVSGCFRITSLAPLRNVRTIYASECESLHSLQGLEGGSTVHLVLARSRVRDLTPLRGVKTLHSVMLNGSLLVRDVSALAAVPHVDLRMCKSVRDVSALGACRNLVLDHCANVRGVGALMQVRRVSFAWTTFAAYRDRAAADQIELRQGTSLAGAFGYNNRIDCSE